MVRCQYAIQQVLHPHISTLLEGEEWDAWCERLSRLAFRPKEVEEVGAAARVWKSQRRPSRKEAAAAAAGDGEAADTLEGPALTF